MSEKILAKFKPVIDDLKRGDHIRFNASILSMGDS
jgi:hypothetical protein